VWVRDRVLTTTKNAHENEGYVSMRRIGSRNISLCLAMKGRLNNERGWRQGSFCFALTGLVAFMGD
jgi:hypothetical protein